MKTTSDKRREITFLHPIFNTPISRKQAAAEALIYGEFKTVGKLTKREARKIFPNFHF